MPLPQVHPSACSFRRDSEIFGKVTDVEAMRWIENLYAKK
jgi:hypothetical protein